MLIYNVTVKLDTGTEAEWLEWMRTVHIPEVMATGLFTGHRVCRLLNDETDGTTYAIQYECRSQDDYEEYRQKHGPGLQNRHTERFGSRFTAFRSLMEVIK